MTTFITLHDAEAPKKKHPAGKPVRVRVASIDMIRPYPEQRFISVRAVVTVHGAHLHVTETEDEIMLMLNPWGGEG